MIGSGDGIAKGTSTAIIGIVDDKVSGPGQRAGEQKTATSEKNSAAPFWGKKDHRSKPIDWGDGNMEIFGLTRKLQTMEFACKEKMTDSLDQDYYLEKVPRGESWAVWIQASGTIEVPLTRRERF